jgi:two-component system, LytTR family, sensor kinase
MIFKKPIKYFWLVLGFWTIIGIILGTTYLAKYPPPDTIQNFYFKGYILGLIVGYLNALQFPVILKTFKYFEKIKAQLYLKVPVYFLMCFCSLAILWLIRSSYFMVFFNNKDLDLGVMFEGFRIWRIFSYDGMLCIILNVFIIYTKDYYDLFKEGQLKAAQLEVELVKSQLESLKIQIHPHFLFNTLHLIASLIREKDNDLALKMTTSLSNFLRYTLNNHSKDFVSLEQEMEMIYLYFQIQEIRFNDRLKVNYNLPSEVKDSSIPNMILQPLVENAIRHGISQKVEKGNIDIEVKRDNGRLRIMIRDDGPGINAGLENLVQNGIGLKNTITRLEKYYNNDFKFEINNIDHGGASVIMEIPFKKNGGSK